MEAVNTATVWGQRRIWWWPHLSHLNGKLSIYTKGHFVLKLGQENKGPRSRYPRCSELIITSMLGFIGSFHSCIKMLGGLGEADTQ